MRKSLLTLALCIAGLGASAAVPQTSAPATDLKTAATTMMQTKQLREAGIYSNDKINTNDLHPSRLPQYKDQWEGTDTVAYFVGAQSFVDANGYTFVYEGGDVKNYEMGVVHQGSKVVFTNLFNFYIPGDWQQNFDFPVEGVYDEAAGTITIDLPAPCMSWQVGYKVGEIWSFSEFNENGGYDESSKLSQMVFSVTPDFKEIEAQTYLCCVAGQSFAQRYKSFKAVKEDPNDPAHIRALVSNIDFGKTYPGMPVKRTVKLVNDGGQDGEFVLTVDSDDDAISSVIVSGLIPAYDIMEIEFTFDPQTPATYEGLVTIETENDEPILLTMNGEAMKVPDYSAIVKNGDFTFLTSPAYPAKVQEVRHPIYDENGEPVYEDGMPKIEKIKAARLATGGAYGQSDITAYFNVPEGQTGKLTFRMHVSNPNNISYQSNSFILVDDDNVYEHMYLSLEADMPAEDLVYDFAPGDHYLYIVHLDGKSNSKDVCTYIWDLNLELSEAGEAGPEMKTPEVFLGYGIAGEGYTTEKLGNLVLRNKGEELIHVTNVTCDNPEFSYSIPKTEAGLYEEISVPIEMTAKTPGEKVANFVIETNLGSVEAVATATVGAYPDYESLCDENPDLFAYEINQAYPFVVEDGKMYNITSKHLDSTPGTQVKSNMIMYVTVPEKMIGLFHFNGHNWGTPTDMYVKTDLWDWGGIQCGFPQTVNGIDGFMSGFWDNDIDINEQYWANAPDTDPIFCDYLTFVPGTTWVEFMYTQGGDNSYYGEDRIEIYNFGVTIVDPASVEDIISGEVVAVEYYDLQGRRLQSLQDGINVIRNIHADGTAESKKVMIRK